MKKGSIVVVVVLFAIWAAQDIIHDFIANDTIHYFTDQPHRLLYVAAIAVSGGLVAFVFDRLPPRARRNVRLLIFGSAAGAVTLYIGYFLFELARLRSPLRAFDGTGWFALLPLCIGIVSTVAAACAQESALPSTVAIAAVAEPTARAYPVCQFARYAPKD